MTRPYAEFRAKLIPYFFQMKCGWKTKIFNEYTSDIDDSFICGEGCVIHSHVSIGQNVIFANNVEIGAFCKIADNTVVDHDTKIGTGVTIANVEGDTGNRITFIGHNVFIGKEAQLITGIKVGDRSRIGAGALVVEDVPDGVQVCGKPAEIHNRIGY